VVRLRHRNLDDNLTVPVSDELFTRRRVGASIAATAQSFTTLFASDENPISETGAWQRLTGTSGNTLWHDVKILSGNAIATANAGPTAGGPGSGDYDDSYSYLTGSWPSNMESIATIYKGTGAKEVELLFRIFDVAPATNTVRGYECTFDLLGGNAIVRWNGSPDDFVILKDTTTGLTDWTGGNDGDKVKANILGTVISMWYARAATPTTWVSIGSYDTSGDATKFSDGAPGIGFFARAAASNTDYGFKDFQTYGI
jgi:hypothetical protein